MIQRLREGKTDVQDLTFYIHELKESSLMDKGIGAVSAHQETLRWQGIPYMPGYESQIYHPDVIRQFS